MTNSSKTQEEKTPEEKGCAIIIGIFLILVCIISILSPSSSYDTTDAEYNQLYEGRQNLKSTLRDPDSLQIISEDTIGGVYHAKFRAKNGFGGYEVSDYFDD